jgi:hypothetical protein
MYGSGVLISSSLSTGTTERFTTNLGTITCKKSTLGGKLTSTEAHGTVTTFTHSECTDPFGNPCTATAANLSYTWIIYWTPGNGRWDKTIRDDPPRGPPRVSLACGSFMNCSVGGPELIIEFRGGSPAKLAAATVSLSREGGLCPAEAFWDAEYTIASPTPLYAA